ncbi:hypothetical protein D3C85_943240 [compost metagenome]
MPGAPRRWKVISGGGAVDANGRFSAPAQGAASSSVVQCEIVRNGVVLSSGYSVVDLSEEDPEPTWENLTSFSLKVPGGLDDERLGSLYANGYQQLFTQIRVEPTPVDGVAYRLSVIERASMRLVEDSSKDDMEFVDDALEGIPEGDAEIWRSRLVGNRFDPAIPRMAREEDSPRVDPIVSELDIFVHSRARGGVTTTFHAMFQADTQKWWRSSDVQVKSGKIQLTTLPIPELSAADYTFERVRVDGGSGAPDEPEDDDFDFHLRTVDYWTLKYTGRPGGIQGVSFETLEFLPIDGKEINTTTIRWESEQIAERMFSWTGYIFVDPKIPAENENINFDQVSKDVMSRSNLDVKVNKTFFEQGTLVISLHRLDDVVYMRPIYPSRVKLSRDMAVSLIDKRGNTHKRRISFLAPSVVGSRNRLVHTLFTPT